jgi:hypothetical protein
MAGRPVTLRSRTYRNPEAAILDGRDPDKVAVAMIHLTEPQHRRLFMLSDGGWQSYVGPNRNYDTLSDWGLIHCRFETCQISARGQRWLNQARALPRLTGAR